jgi:hypothetical protein
MMIKVRVLSFTNDDDDEEVGIDMLFVTVFFSPANFLFVDVVAIFGLFGLLDIRDIVDDDEGTVVTIAAVGVLCSCCTTVVRVFVINDFFA